MTFVGWFNQLLDPFRRQYQLSKVLGRNESTFLFKYIKRRLKLAVSSYVS